MDKGTADLRTSSSALPTEVEASPISTAADDLDKHKAITVFKYLLVFAATLEAFAHGANDTANATAGLIPVIMAFQYGLYTCDDSSGDQWWIMIFAGFFVFVGVTCLGWKVIKTIGNDLAVVDFHRGFCVEFASTSTVVIATVLGFPVSTTHCQVGAVVACSWAALGRQNVAWSLIGKIGLGWIVTLPLAGGVAALFTVILENAITS